MDTVVHGDIGCESRIGQVIDWGTLRDNCRRRRLRFRHQASPILKRGVSCARLLPIAFPRPRWYLPSGSHGVHQAHLCSCLGWPNRLGGPAIDRRKRRSLELSLRIRLHGDTAFGSFVVDTSRWQLPRGTLIQCKLQLNALTCDLTCFDLGRSSSEEPAPHNYFMFFGQCMSYVLDYCMRV